jgi:ubiquinone/menaquinone biosynthesis C-methylase UbiE
MKKKQVNKILKHVKEDYSASAEEFDERRQTPWKEFKLFLKYIKNNDKVSDIGCGNGRFLDFLKNKRKINYTGVDITKNLIDIAKKRYAGTFLVANAFDTGLKDNQFDTTVSIATLHHIPSKSLREKTIKEMHRITKKEGFFIISVWNLYRKKFIKYFLRSLIKSIISGFSKNPKDLFIPWGSKKTLRYFYALSTKEMTKLIKSNGFEIIEKHKNKNLVYICKKI